MKATSIIGSTFKHATDPSIQGSVVDVLVDLPNSRCDFVLISVESDKGGAELLFSPAVLFADAEGVTTTAHPDDIAERVATAMARAHVEVNPADLPLSVIGPFGNTISPAMIAALFNSRWAEETRPEVSESGGFWFSTLIDHPVMAHVTEVGRVSDLDLDDHLTVVTAVMLSTPHDGVKLIKPELLTVKPVAESGVMLKVDPSHI